MLKLFEFPGGTSIAYGDGRIELIARDVKNISGGSKAVIVTDRGVVRAGLVDVVLKALKKEGIEPKLFTNLQGNPTAKSIGGQIVSSLVTQHQIFSEITTRNYYYLSVKTYHK